MPGSDKEETVTVLCPECGTLIEIHDIRAYLLSAHLVDSCTSTEALRNR